MWTMLRAALYFAVTLLLASAEGRPDKKVLGATAEPTCPTGAILLSYGRSATDTIAETVVKSSSLSFCHGIKEYYKRGAGTISRESMNACMERHGKNGGVFIHVKPWHIINPRGASWVTPEWFFDTAHKLGFTQVITSFRDNQLAREVSSFEQSLVKGKRNMSPNSKSFGSSHLVDDFEQSVKDFNRCIHAIQAVNLTIHSLDFDMIIHGVCPSAKAIVNATIDTVKHRFGSRGCAIPHLDTCDEFVGHTDKSHRNRDLSGRIGEANAEKVTNQLKGTPYEWMLQLDATKWPSDIPRKVVPEHGEILKVKL